MTKPSFFRATIYNLVGDNKQPGGCVGITFQPTPSLSANELEVLIKHLQIVLGKVKGEIK